MTKQSKYSWSDADKMETDPNAIADHFDQFSESYDNTVSAWGYDSPKVVASLLNIHLPSAGPILDAGCGTGLSGKALQEAGFKQIYGCDISAKSVEIAAQTGAYLETFIQDLNQPIPKPPRFFNAIISVGVLAFFDDLRPVMIHFCDGTQPGGLILFSQRQDIYRSGQNEGQFAELEAKGKWKAVYQTEWMPYLTNNRDYQGIRVKYFAYEVL